MIRKFYEAEESGGQYDPEEYIKSLNKVIVNKEKERDEWSKMCIKKQGRIEALENLLRFTDCPEVLITNPTLAVTSLQLTDADANWAKKQIALHESKPPQPLHHQGRTVEEVPYMTPEEFFNTPGGMFTLDFLSQEEKKTIYKATELYVKGRLRYALQPPPTAEQGEAIELLKKLVIAVKDNYCVDLQVQLAEEYLKNSTPS